MTPATNGADSPAPGTPWARWAWTALAIVWAGYFLLRALDAPEAVERIAKGLLMPALLVAVVGSLGRATPRLLVVGLLWATVGDVAIDIVFEAGMVGFLIMQLTYIVGFVGLGAVAGLRRRWPAAVGYAALWVVVNVLLGPELGELRVPVLVYSAAICTMAALAAGVSARVGVGAALFVASDALLGAGVADVDFPGRSALVLPAYLAGQYLIATGWARAVRPDVRLPL
jgi:uncharacterized membrane protein YhhN